LIINLNCEIIKISSGINRLTIFVLTFQVKIMIVYKFGGASVNDAQGVKQLASLVAKVNDPLIVVVSAMGKTTNKLETIVAATLQGNARELELISNLRFEHNSILNNLFKNSSHSVFAEIEKLFDVIERNCNSYRNKGYDMLYDQVVSYGEIISTKIVSAYLNQNAVKNKWVDIRKVIITDDNYRDAQIDVAETAKKCNTAFDYDGFDCYVTQGFIASDKKGNVTTLGREGSDYTAALLASILDAEKVILWKDVQGIYNADPLIFDDAIFLEELTYQEVIELTFYGAKVIHPKTIKPLRNKQIPLFVKCFYEPRKKGTTVKETKSKKINVPVFIVLNEQVLLSISLGDLSFITERHISRLFALLNKFKLKVNLMQNSAVTFSVCIDTPKGQEITELVDLLRKDFKVLYNQDLTLNTIRNYNEAHIKKMIGNKKVLMEQRSRNTVQFVTETI